MTEAIFTVTSVAFLSDIGINHYRGTLDRVPFLLYNM